MKKSELYKYIDDHAYEFLNEVIINILAHDIMKQKKIDTSKVTEFVPLAYEQGFMDCLDLIYFIHDDTNIPIERWLSEDI